MFTTTRMKKLIVGLVLVAATVGTAYAALDHVYIIRITCMVVFYVVVPVTVLVINVMLIREMRQASNNAAANLGRQQHHNQSQSAVPTVMLVTTSLIYVLLSGTWTIMYLINYYFQPQSTFFLFVHRFSVALSRFIYAYNFYVYLITCKQFRSNLRTFICRCSSVAAASQNRNDIRQAEHTQADTVV